jgi:adenine-specific DNA-methyltransferase
MGTPDGRSSKAGTLGGSLDWQEADSVERRRRAAQGEFDASRNNYERNRLGQFATPNTLAVELARYVGTLMSTAFGPIRFADPSVGTGSFFSAALQVYGKNRIESAIGIEIDPDLYAAAQNVWRDSSMQLVCGDFTRVIGTPASPPSPNLILANPPYVRHHHITRENKERLQALVSRMTKIEVSGLAGLYVYFILLATAWMEDGGYGAWLIPSEFMDVNYGSALKRYLTESVTLLRVHRFDPADVQFDDALVSSVAVVLHKSRPSAAHAVEFTFGGTLARPVAKELVKIDRLRDARKWTCFPSHPGSDRAPSNGEEEPQLGELFRIQRGIATGNNKFFVLDRAEAIRRGFPGKFLRPILPSPRQLRTTIVEGGSDGYPLLENPLCVIDCDLQEEVLKTRHPELWAYLEGARALGIRDGYLVGRRDPWYRQERRNPPLFLCTYMGRGSNDKAPFRFIWNRSQAIATNLYLMLYPRDEFKERLIREPERVSDVFEFLQQVTGNELRGAGRVYGGGLHKIEPRELARVSVTALLEKWPALASIIRSQGLLLR